MSREICITWEYPQYAFTYVSTYGWRYINCHNHSVQGNFNTKEAKTPKKWRERGFFVLLRKIERSERKWYFSDNPIANYLRIIHFIQIIPQTRSRRKIVEYNFFLSVFHLKTRTIYQNKIYPIPLWGSVVFKYSPSVGDDWFTFRRLTLLSNVPPFQVQGSRWHYYNHVTLILFIEKAVFWRHLVYLKMRAWGRWEIFQSLPFA